MRVSACSPPLATAYADDGVAPTAWLAHMLPMIDPELFFPVGNAGPALLQIAQAKQVCAGCPVRMPCLQRALDSGQETGVWGGTSEEERRALRYQRSRRPDGPDKAIS